MEKSKLSQIDPPYLSSYQPINHSQVPSSEDSVKAPIEAPMPPNSDVTEPLPPWHWVDCSDPQWGLQSTEEPLTPELKDKIREDLKDYYHYWRRDQKFREYVRVFINNSPGLTLSDTDPKLLFDNPFCLRMFCNKATTLYWSYSMMPKYPNPRFPSVPICGIYSEWMRYHSNFPNIDFGHFFSSCCAITETGPTRIAGIIQAHKSMCDQVALLLSKLDRPHESCSWRNCRFYCNYKLIPLCRAIIAILDEKDSWNDRQNLEEIDLWSPTQSLLLVRTSDESNLSTPISFSDIEKHSLSLSKNDLEAKAEGIDVIRVTLPVAVRFIAELEERENAAFPELRNNAVEMDLCPDIEFGDLALNVDTWVEKIMQEAEEKGVDNVERTWQSVRRVKAAQRGEVFRGLERLPNHLGHRSA